MKDADRLRQQLEQIDLQIEAAEAELDVLRMTRRRLEAEAELQKLFANTSGFLDEA
jgi:cell division protein FtsB